MLRVRCLPVKCVELFTIEGKSLGLFREREKWEGMRKLTRVDGDREIVIVDVEPSRPDLQADEEAPICDVVKASPMFHLEVARR
jgi:hypothetical protein